MQRSFYLLAILFAIILSIKTISVKGLNAKPYIGLHGGINFSQPLLLNPYSIITLLSGEVTQERDYDPLFRNFGYQLGFSFFLPLNDFFSVGLIPELVQYSYGYTSNLEFFDNEGNAISDVENTSNQRVNYLNFPLLLKYTIRRSNSSPYLLGGMSYAYLRNAQHEVLTVNNLHIPTGDLEFNSSTSDNYTSEFIHSKLNLFGGAGYSYDFKQCLVSLDICYWIGLHNLSNEANRFQNQTISGSTYDIPDDIKLNHWVASISVLFPINKVNTKGSMNCTPFKKRK